MARVRKINVSQVEGDNSNNTTANEIRPYGELAVYVGDNDKLELLIADGVRTNLKNKVLNKGTFYGGDSDSGDGAGLDTIKLVPDATLHYNTGSYGNDQHIIVDPTAPNHIHLRAGGTIDNSNAELFLGGELNNVKVSDIYDNVQITTDAGVDGTRTWTFNNTGGLVFPNDAAIVADESNLEIRDANNFNVEVTGVVNIYTDANNLAHQWQFGDDGVLTLPPSGLVKSANYGGFSLRSFYDTPLNGVIGSNVYISAGQVSINYQVEVDGAPVPGYQWDFNSVTRALDLADGGLKFADNTTQTTAYTGIDTGTVSFNFNQISGNTNDGAGTIYTKTQDKDANNYSTGAGSLGFLSFNADGEVENIKAGWTITFASGETQIVANDAYQPIGTYWTIPFSSAYNWSAGDVMPISFSSPDYIAASDPVLELKPDADTNNSWTFNGNGNIEFPDSTVQSTAYAPVTGSWTLPDDTTDTYSFTVPQNGTYTMWVRANIPNGIITWNATVTVTNANVPAIGSQYAWNYTDAGTPIEFISIPDQIRGVAGTISTDATYAGTTSNRFDFGISNGSGSSQTVNWGYTKI